MMTRRVLPWTLLLLTAAVGLLGCEPYMSMTDRIPAQTRQATALLPEAPRYAGMVDLETVMAEVDEIGEAALADSLRASDGERLRTFLDATGMNPRTDLKAVYGAIGSDDSFSAVVFADLSPDQMDRYLDRRPDDGRRTAYRDVPLYLFPTGMERDDKPNAPDTLALAFVRSGTIAAGTDVGSVKAMVDRHRSETNSFRGNKPYMSLVERVGHGSTAWIVGRDVLQTALQDSVTGTADARPGTLSGGVSRAGVQQLLSGWADRVLGVSDAPPISEVPAGGKMEQLKSRIREQAVSVTLTEETLDGEMYLTMRDEASATDVVDLSKGAVAALRLSEKFGDEEAGGFLDDVKIERDGPVVHVQFAMTRTRLRDTMGETHTARRAKSSTRRAKATTHRLGGITRSGAALGRAHMLTRACNLCADRPVSPNPGRADG